MCNVVGRSSSLVCDVVRRSSPLVCNVVGWSSPLVCNVVGWSSPFQCMFQPRVKLSLVLNCFLDLAPRKHLLGLKNEDSVGGAPSANQSTVDTVF